ncbi:hypothetical protein CR513_32630, partial [Mucuna pruriens]
MATGLTFRVELDCQHGKCHWVAPCWACVHHVAARPTEASGSRTSQSGRDDSPEPRLLMMAEIIPADPTRKRKVQVAKTKKLFPAQVATMFTAEYESTKEGRVQERTEVILIKKTSVKADPHVHVQVETISAKEDQKQARAKSISVNQGKNRIPSRSDFSTKPRVEFDSRPTRVQG